MFLLGGGGGLEESVGQVIIGFRDKNNDFHKILFNPQNLEFASIPEPYVTNTSDRQVK